MGGCLGEDSRVFRCILCSGGYAFCSCCYEHLHLRLLGDISLFNCVLACLLAYCAARATAKISRSCPSAGNLTPPIYAKVRKVHCNAGKCNAASATKGMAKRPNATPSDASCSSNKTAVVTENASLQCRRSLGAFPRISFSSAAESTSLPNEVARILPASAASSGWYSTKPNRDVCFSRPCMQHRS